MEVSNVHILSLRNKRNFRTSYSKRTEGTAAVWLQSRLDDKWRSDSMEYYYYLRNVQDLLTDGKTPYERRFEDSFEGQIIPFDALVEYFPNSERHNVRTKLLRKDKRGPGQGEERLTKIQTTSRPDHIWPDAWIWIAKVAQRSEKWEWTVEESKFEFIRNLKEIYSIDPSDEEHKDII